MASQHESLARSVAIAIVEMISFNKNVSLAAFRHGDIPELLFTFGRYSEKKEVIDFFKSADMVSDEVKFANSFPYALNRLFKYGTGWHASIPKTLIFITNKEPSYEIESLSRVMGKKGTKLIVIGIGDDVKRFGLVPLAAGNIKNVAVITKEGGWDDIKPEIVRPGIYHSCFFF